MNGISVTRERADHKPGILDLLLERCSSFCGLQTSIEIDVVTSGPAAGSDLDGRDLGIAFQLGQHLCQAQFCKDGIEDTKSHSIYPRGNTIVFKIAYDRVTYFDN